MRIFVSSSFEDLKEHRARVIAVLRQLGHEVLAMEDMTAAAHAPLAAVLAMVDRSELYVGLFAWRYGYVPGRSPAGDLLPPPAGGASVPHASWGDTSITHYEYLRAVQRQLPVLAFLLDEQCPWPPQLVDGFDTARPGAPANADRIRGLRQQLQAERVVSWFRTPSDLESRVSAAVTMAGVTSQLDLRQETALDPVAGVPGDSSTQVGVANAIISAANSEKRALKIDLKTTWWSSRLYLIAALANRLTPVSRILVVDSRPEAGTPGAPTAAPAAAPPPAAEERLVGQLSVQAILSTIGPKVPALLKFRDELRQRSADFNDVQQEVFDLLNVWLVAFDDQLGAHANERAAKVDLNPKLLQRWFGDAMLQQPLQIKDLKRASILDILRLLDYPNDFVPVRHAEHEAAPARVDVMDKAALNARLARSYIVELRDRGRLM